jgi:hypothetical protein
MKQKRMHDDFNRAGGRLKDVMQIHHPEHIKKTISASQ